MCHQNLWHVCQFSWHLLTKITVSKIGDKWQILKQFVNNICSHYVCESKINSGTYNASTFIIQNVRKFSKFPLQPLFRWTSCFASKLLWLCGFWRICEIRHWGEKCRCGVTPSLTRIVLCFMHWNTLWQIVTLSLTHIVPCNVHCNIVTPSLTHIWIALDPFVLHAVSALCYMQWHIA